MAPLDPLRTTCLRYLIVYCLIVTLVSCASISEQVLQGPADWDERLQAQRQINDWAIKARLGVQTETEGGSFDVFWQQHDGGFDIRLIAPMGQGAVHIDGDADGVLISLANGRMQYSDNPDDLFAEMTGLSLPVNSLQDWLRGMPIQNEPVQYISWNESGQLYKIEQGGWRVEMSRYQTIDGYELPNKFYLEREDRPELSVRLLVREWRLGPTEQ